MRDCSKHARSASEGQLLFESLQRAGHDRTRLLAFWKKGCRPPWQTSPEAIPSREACEFASVPFTPESLSLALAALYWIVWPLVLVSMSGLMRRENG